MASIGDWIARYLDRLRPELRTDSADRRLQAAARLADNNGWTPTDIAERVNSGNYATARNPVIIALLEMERVAGNPPHTDTDHTAIGCNDCVHGWNDNPTEPVTEPCRKCHPQLAARIDRIPKPGDRKHEHYAYIRHNRTMR